MYLKSVLLSFLFFSPSPKNAKIYLTVISISAIVYLTLNLLDILNGIIHLPFLEQSIIIFLGYQDENLMLVRQQYRAWSDCTECES